jgi:hypothetical protein
VSAALRGLLPPLHHQQMPCQLLLLRCEEVQQRLLLCQQVLQGLLHLTSCRSSACSAPSLMSACSFLQVAQLALTWGLCLCHLLMCQLPLMLVVVLQLHGPALVMVL